MGERSSRSSSRSRSQSPSAGSLTSEQLFGDTWFDSSTHAAEAQEESRSATASPLSGAGSRGQTVRLLTPESCGAESAMSEASLSTDINPVMPPSESSSAEPESSSLGCDAAPGSSQD